MSFGIPIQDYIWILWRGRFPIFKNSSNFTKGFSNREKMALVVKNILDKNWKIGIESIFRCEHVLQNRTKRRRRKIRHLEKKTWKRFLIHHMHRVMTGKD